MKVEKAYTRGYINIMAQALQTEDGSLPQGLTVQNMYTELWQGSKKAVVVVRNSRGLSTDHLKENPGGQGSLGNPIAWVTRRSPVTGGGKWAAGSLCPKTDCQAKTWKVIWWTGFEWVRLLAPRDGRCCLPTFGQVSQCVFVGPHRVGLYSLYGTYDKSNGWQPL